VPGSRASWDADLFGRIRADERAARARLDAAGLDASAVRLTLVTDVARNLVAARSALARERIAQGDGGDGAPRPRPGREASSGRVGGGDRHQPSGDPARRDRGGAAADPGGAIGPGGGAGGAHRACARRGPAAGRPVAAGSRASRRPAAGIPSDLLLRRPDIAAALARVAAADAATAAAVAARYPRLSITSAIGLVAAALGDIFSLEALSASAGPGLAGSILDFGRNRARADQSRAQAREAVAAWRGTVLRAFSEVETSLAAVDARERQRLALLGQLAAAGETVEIARKQYSSGLTDYLGVLDAERAVNRARDQLAAVEAEAADAQLALYRAIGGDFANHAAEPLNKRLIFRASPA
jgi:outer membrane protein TolC